MSTASERLARKLELLTPAYGTPGRLLIEHPDARERCPPYLAVGAYVALMMVPLMEAALERARVLAPGDPVAAGLVGYLEHHIPEEMHGDEPGGELLEDLEALGVDTAALRSGPVPEGIAALIGAQAFRIRHAHPVAVLGFLWLEMFPPAASSVEELIAATGLPRAGFRQLLLHSEVDVRHGRELREALDALPLEPWHEQIVGLSALETMGHLIGVWLDVLAPDGAVAVAV
ncbi:MAG TPA: iron-containing redox enzyme family protein [Solirubrobacteraceae bacterium]|nr:iron-containing redox enzyme family protein [Solirubrobacteraceae bacterium]